MYAVRITDIEKSFNGAEILKGITLELEEGKAHGLVGANGCGKSVLMQIIAGLIKPDKGTVCVFDRQIGKDADFPDHTGILINGPAFIDSYSARMNLRLLAAYKTVSGGTK